ncbi:hypothetical protein KQX54_000423 [Cotesia glomerata]|uniref:Uncharacterized protein n=1 Tax=Cotesia glomerata TaxID=32391 RepID=A0AAV7HMX2_COTGL|nr:hypothetical protein KQX54_000423 [Cotesia glomerata]
MFGLQSKNYNNAKAAAGTDAIFVKNIAVDIVYSKSIDQLSEDEINARIDDYTDYIRVKISDLERPKKSTRSEGSDKKEDEKNKTRNNAPALKKKTDESSSEGTSFSEAVPIRKEESADSERERESKVVAMNVH